MAKWQIDGKPIQAPDKKTRNRDIQTADHRAINGSFSRDYVGDEKLVLECEWANMSLADYTILSDARDRQINLALGIRLTINETGLVFNGLTILDLPDIKFHLPNHYQYRNIKATFYQLDAVS